MKSNTDHGPVVSKLRTPTGVVTLYADRLLVRRGFKTVEHRLTASTVAHFDKDGECTESVTREATLGRWLVLGPAALAVEKKRKHVHDNREVSVRIDGDGWHESITAKPVGKTEQNMRDFVAKVNHAVAQRFHAAQAS